MMRSKLWRILSGIVLAATVALICGSVLRIIIDSIRNNAHIDPVATWAPSPTPSEVAPVAYGNGIYYFPVTDDQYMRSLAKFYQLFKNLRCDYQGHTEKWNGALLKTTGFILHCREGAVEAQSITVP